MKIKALAIALCLLPLTAQAGDNDDFGTWYELGATKSLPKHFEVGVYGDLRTENNSKQVDRWTLGLYSGYRLNKYVKFGLSYQFLDYYNTDKRKEHYKTDDDGNEKLDVDGNPIWNGYKLTNHYWMPKHRVYFEATGTLKLSRWFRLSLRERYQFTHAGDKTVSTEKHRYDVSKDGDGHYTPIMTEEKDGYPEYEDEVKEGENTHLLRSRLKLEIDKKHFDWSPFISIEAHNSLTESLHLEKLRAAIGTGYKINKHHSVSLSYVMTCDFDEQPHQRMHAINLGYDFDF